MPPKRAGKGPTAPPVQPIQDAGGDIKLIGRQGPFADFKRPLPEECRVGGRTATTARLVWVSRERSQQVDHACLRLFEPTTAGCQEQTGCAACKLYGRTEYQKEAGRGDSR